jgi:hypothetical protein
MISGDLIRIKNMVDDCVRLARSIQREAERLTPEEQAHLASHLAVNSAQLNYLVGLLSKADEPASAKV